MGHGPRLQGTQQDMPTVPAVVTFASAPSSLGGNLRVAQCGPMRPVPPCSPHRSPALSRALYAWESYQSRRDAVHHLNFNFHLNIQTPSSDLALSLRLSFLLPCWRVYSFILFSSIVKTVSLFSRALLGVHSCASNPFC
jgi:hypothetical protein